MITVLALISAASAEFGSGAAAMTQSICEQSMAPNLVATLRVTVPIEPVASALRNVAPPGGCSRWGRL